MYALWMCVWVVPSFHLNVSVPFYIWLCCTQISSACILLPFLSSFFFGHTFSITFFLSLSFYIHSAVGKRRLVLVVNPATNGLTPTRIVEFKINRSLNDRVDHDGWVHLSAVVRQLRTADCHLLHRSSIRHTLKLHGHHQKGPKNHHRPTAF